MDTSIALNIFLGIVAGILTTVILFGLGQLFNKVFIPWYQDLIYKGLDVSGRWFERHNYENLVIQESVITIKQTANRIIGEIILAKKSSSTNAEIEVKAFSFQGEFYNNFLNITCWNKDKKQIGTHNYLMTIEMDGRGMKGMKTYFDIGFQKIKTDDVHWTRKKES